MPTLVLGGYRAHGGVQGPRGVQSTQGRLGSKRGSEHAGAFRVQDGFRACGEVQGPRGVQSTRGPLGSKICSEHAGEFRGTVTFFIRTFFIRNKNLYKHYLYVRKFIRDKDYTVTKLYKHYLYCNKINT
jgi:hypothetical protein